MQQDIHHVKPEHKAADAELVNWASWCRGHRSGSVASSPMWALYRATARSGEQYGAATASAGPDIQKAIRTEHRLAEMPAPVAAVVRWWYVKGGPPWAVARTAGRCATWQGCWTRGVGCCRHKCRSGLDRHKCRRP
jgi:hypothetical protein